MPQYVVVHAAESSAFSHNAPRTPDIRSALVGIRWSDPQNVTHFVGPSPRVTRRGGTWSAMSDTFVTWVLQIPDNNEPITTRLPVIAGTVGQALHAMPNTSWGATTASLFNPAINGTILWWLDGHGASQTHTRDDFPSGSLTAAENPIGPSSGDISVLHPEDFLNPETRQAQELRNAGSNATKTFVVVAVVAIIGLIAIAPAVNAIGKRMADPLKSPFGERDYRRRRNPDGDDRYFRGWE